MGGYVMHTFLESIKNSIPKNYANTLGYTIEEFAMKNIDELEPTSVLSPGKKDFGRTKEICDKFYDVRLKTEDAIYYFDESVGVKGNDKVVKLNLPRKKLAWWHKRGRR